MLVSTEEAARNQVWCATTESNIDTGAYYDRLGKLDIRVLTVKVNFWESNYGNGH